MARALASGSWKTATPVESWKSSLFSTSLLLALELDAADVFYPQEPAVRRGTDDNVLELGRVGEAAQGGEGELVFLLAAGGRLADLAGRDLHVLLPDGVDHVHGRQAARGQPVGVYPDAHTVVLFAEQEHVADAVHALYFVRDVNEGVVADVQLVEAVVRRIEADDEQDVGVAFAGGDADLLDHVGQLRQGEVDAVLHQHLGEIQVDAGLERHAEAVGAVVGCLRGHVEHVFDAVDLLLDGGGDALGHGLGVGAGVGGGDDDARRRDLRVLGDRQVEYGDSPGQGNDDGQDRGEDRPVDEESRKQCASPRVSPVPPTPVSRDARRSAA